MDKKVILTILEKLSILLLSSITNFMSLNKIKNRLGVSFEMTSRY